MRMVAPARYWTVDEVLALPEDGRRYELIDGVLLVNGVAVLNGNLAGLDPVMTPSPSWTHQRAVLELARMLAAYVDRWLLGQVLIAPADVPLQPGQLVQPDIFVVPFAAGGRAPSGWADVGRLLLAVEVLSPTSVHSDTVRKRALYQRAGVPEYWIVDVDGRRVERWRPGGELPERHDTTLEWSPGGAAEPLRLDVAGYFGAVVGPAAKA